VLEAVTIYGIIAVLLWRSSLPTIVRVVLPILFSVLIVFVAIARVAVKAHYPSDVLAGFLAGIGCLALFAIITGLLARRRAASKTTSASASAKPSSASSAS
jgi:undecaprenyl-diphosphatase